MSDPSNRFTVTQSASLDSKQQQQQHQAVEQLCCCHDVLCGARDSWIRSQHTLLGGYEWHMLPYATVSRLPSESWCAFPYSSRSQGLSLQSWEESAGSSSIRIAHNVTLKMSELKPGTSCSMPHPPLQRVSYPRNALLPWTCLHCCTQPATFGSLTPTFHLQLSSHTRIRDHCR